MHLHAQPGSFCKGNVTFFNDLQDNKLETVASKLHCVYTFWNNCNGTLHVILMHESAAPNTSAELCDELWWGEVNCDLKPCPLRRHREILYCINMKDLNITSFCNKYSLLSSRNYTYLYFSATPWPRLKVTKDKEFHLHVFSHLSTALHTTEMERRREGHLFYLHVCLRVSITGGNKQWYQWLIPTSHNNTHDGYNNCTHHSEGAFHLHLHAGNTPSVQYTTAGASSKVSFTLCFPFQCLEQPWADFTPEFLELPTLNFAMR